MTRLFIIALVLAVIVLLARSLLRTGQEKAASSTEMVQDPECLTYVPRPEAISRQIGDQEYYFCSQRCADEYKPPEDPTAT